MNEMLSASFPVESVKIEFNEFNALRKCPITPITSVNLTILSLILVESFIG